MFLQKVCIVERISSGGSNKGNKRKVVPSICVREHIAQCKLIMQPSSFAYSVSSDCIALLPSAVFVRSLPTVSYIHSELPLVAATPCPTYCVNSSRTTIPDMLHLAFPYGNLESRSVNFHISGYPDHMPFGQFRRRFELLVPCEMRQTGPVLDERLTVENMMHHLDMEASSYRLGMSMVWRL